MEIRDIEVGISFEDGRELWERVALGTAATVQGVQQRKNGTTFPVEVRVGVRRVSCGYDRGIRGGSI
jgi:hypothetical protein